MGAEAEAGRDGAAKAAPGRTVLSALDQCIVSAYERGDKVIVIAAENNVSEGRVQFVVRRAGLPLRRLKSLTASVPPPKRPPLGTNAFRLWRRAQAEQRAKNVAAREVVPRGGVEPPSSRLQVGRSTV